VEESTLLSLDTLIQENQQLLAIFSISLVSLMKELLKRWKNMLSMKERQHSSGHSSLTQLKKN